MILRIPSKGAIGRAFTLIEILVVVVILGILAAVVVPQYSHATMDAKIQATVDQVVKLREALSVYYVRNAAQFPSVTPGAGTWAELMAQGYFYSPPTNLVVGGTDGYVIKFGTGPDTAQSTGYGWIYNPATGDVWAANFDAHDTPLP